MSHLPSCVPAVALYTSIPGQLALPESQHAWQWGGLPVIQPVCLTSTGMSHMHILSTLGVSCQSVPMQASDRQLPFLKADVVKLSTCWLRMTVPPRVTVDNIELHSNHIDHIEFHFNRQPGILLGMIAT